MAFHNAQFPTDISEGSAGGPGYRTKIVTMASGFEIRQGQWSLPKFQFNVAYGIRTYDDLAAVKDFYIARSGALNSWRFKDLSNYTTASNHRDLSSYTDQVVDSSAADGQTVFQLVQRITDNGTTVIRPVTKPVSGTVTIGVNGLLADPGDYTIDYNLGTLTFMVGLTAGDTVTWGGEFDTHCRFGIEADSLLSATFDDFSSGSITNVPIVEVRDEISVIDMKLAGGKIELTIDSPYTVDLTQGTFFVLVTEDSSEDVILPDPDTYNLATGANLCAIVNGSVSARTLVLKDHDLNTLVTLNPDEGTNCHLTVDADDTKRWYTF